MQLNYITTFAVLAFALLIPNLALAQDEPAKRVSITVTVKEKTQSDILQLPATNLPLTIDKASYKKRIAYKAKKSIPSPAKISSNNELKPVASQKLSAAVKKPMPKPATVTKPANNSTTASLKPKTVAAAPIAKPAAENNTAAVKPVTVKVPATVNDNTAASLKPKTNTGAALKPGNKSTPAKTISEPATVATSTSANNIKPNNTATAIITDEASKKGNKYVTIEDPSNPYVETIATTGKVDKQSTLSYVWIGSILIIAGLVLGLLFGRAAFLVSLVGVIFILLGVLVF